MHLSPVGLPSAPAAFTTEGLRVSGMFAGAIDDLSTATWDGNCGLCSPRRLQRKGWLYVGLTAPRFQIGFAVVDAGLIATAFVYIFDRETGQLHEEKCLRPLGFAAVFAPDWRRPWHLESGARRWQMAHDGSAWHLTFVGPALQLNARVEDHGRGISVISAAPGRPFHHTYKLGGLAAQVTMNRDAGTETFEVRANVDFSLGYPPRETVWNWASLDGVTDDGQPFAVNLVAHFLNGLENALWLDDGVVPLPQALFDYSPDDPLAPWRIRTVDDRINLVFTPEGQRRENLNIGVLKSIFTQPFGPFSGYMMTASGRRNISGHGVVEAHQARW